MMGARGKEEQKDCVKVVQNFKFEKEEEKRRVVRNQDMRRNPKSANAQ